MEKDLEKYIKLRAEFSDETIANNNLYSLDDITRFKCTLRDSVNAKSAFQQSVALSIGIPIATIATVIHMSSFPVMLVVGLSLLVIGAIVSIVASFGLYKSLKWYSNIDIDVDTKILLYRTSGILPNIDSK